MADRDLIKTEKMLASRQNGLRINGRKAFFKPVQLRTRTKQKAIFVSKQGNEI